mmetsp:Transcript_12523/g.24413  ORF Transcript_12523/g.24413 Transcript_12523/m.24413 type:complete len:349 (+) Transcript_12523:71-1117(+)
MTTPQTVVKIVFVTIFILLAVKLFVWDVPRHLRKDEKSGMQYLDSEGLGAVLWGCVALLLGIVLSLRKWGNDEGDPKELFMEPQVPSELGLDEDNLSSVFEAEPSLLRCAKFAACLAQACGNVAFITWVFFTLPPRSPTERLNQAKHLVSWFEFPITCAVASLLLILIPFVCLTGKKNQSTVIAKNLTNMRRFSVLLSLPLANPIKAFDGFQQVKKKEGFLPAAGTLLYTMAIMPVAVMALLVKVSQMAFVNEKIYWDWELGDWLRLAGFANNVISIIPPTGSQYITGVFQFLRMQEPVLQDKWERALGQSLGETRGVFVAVVIMSTLSAEDVCKLLNICNRVERPAE